MSLRAGPDAIAGLASSLPGSPAASRSARLSFIVPLYNGLPLTQALLASLQRTVDLAGGHEVLLVDDGSTDGTRDWLATLDAPYRVILNERNQGYARANNRAAQVATGDLLVLLNNDLILRPRWLEPMLAAEERLGSRAGLIGNLQRSVATGRIDHSGLLIDAKGKPTHDRRRPLRSWLPGAWSVRRVPAVTGACLLVRRQTFLDEGGFSEAFLNGGEDVDLAFRLERRGRQNVVALRSVVDHHVSASPGRKRHDELNTYRLVRRWRPELIRHGARAWAWAHLQREWTSPTDPRHALAAARLLAFALGLGHACPTAATEGMNTAIEAELLRWRTMFPAEEADAVPPNGWATADGHPAPLGHVRSHTCDPI